jgi:hypothetical protein
MLRDRRVNDIEPAQRRGNGVGTASSPRNGRVGGITRLGGYRAAAGTVLG